MAKESGKGTGGWDYQMEANKCLWRSYAPRRSRREKERERPFKNLITSKLLFKYL